MTSFETKEYVHADDDSCQGHRLGLCEPIVFRFNIRDHRSNFYFFCNRCTTSRNHDVNVLNQLMFDDNYCS